MTKIFYANLFFLHLAVADAVYRIYMRFGARCWPLYLVLAALGFMLFATKRLYVKRFSLKPQGKLRVALFAAWMIVLCYLNLTVQTMVSSHVLDVCGQHAMAEGITKFSTQICPLIGSSYLFADQAAAAAGLVFVLMCAAIVHRRGKFPALL